MHLMKQRECVKDQRRKAIMHSPIMEANNDKCDAMDDEKPSHKKMKPDSGEEPVCFLKKESTNECSSPSNDFAQNSSSSYGHLDYSSPSNAFAQNSASSHGHFAQQSANVSGYFQPAFYPNHQMNHLHNGYAPNQQISASSQHSHSVNYSPNSGSTSASVDQINEQDQNKRMNKMMSMCQMTLMNKIIEKI